LRLAERADVVIESFRPGVVARLGIGYDDVSARNPGIVYCSTSGYGQDGPHGQWAGHDLNYLAISGYLDMTERGEGGKPPVPGTKTRDEWTALLAPADTCVAPVVDITEVVQDEQYNARHGIVEAVHPTQGSFRQVGAMLAGQERPDAAYQLPDTDKTDTDD